MFYPAATLGQYLTSTNEQKGQNTHTKRGLYKCICLNERKDDTWKQYVISRLWPCGNEEGKWFMVSESILQNIFCNGLKIIVNTRLIMKKKNHC